MTKKQPGAGWGGRREGAGAKPEPKAPKTERISRKAAATAAEMAKEHASLAVETLALIAAEGASEQARVAAAKALLEFGYGKPASVAAPVKEDPEVVAAAQRVGDWESLLQRAH